MSSLYFLWGVVFSLEALHDPRQRQSSACEGYPWRDSLITFRYRNGDIMAGLDVLNAVLELVPQLLDSLMTGLDVATTYLGQVLAKRLIS